MDVLVTSDSKFGSALLRRVLSRLGHRVQDTGTAGAGTLLANQTWQADVMVAAMVAGSSSRQRYGAVGVEIGVALERGLPVLLVAKPALSLSFLAGIPRVDYAEDEDLLTVQLDLLLQAVGEGSRRESYDRPRQNSARAIASHPAGASHALAFEEQVGNLLRATGAEMLEQARLTETGGRPDFTILVPQAANDLGVVLVEAKASSRPARDRAAAKRTLVEAARQLSQYVLASHSGLGLLVYEGPVIGVPAIPMTMCLSIDQLQDRLAGGSLEQVLRQARNEAIHAL